MPGLNMPSCIRDASPDAWRRRVLISRKSGIKGGDAALVELDELSYLLDSGSDRIGALDFQQSATEYVPSHTQQASGSHNKVLHYGRGNAHPGAKLIGRILNTVGSS